MVIREHCCIGFWSELYGLPACERYTPFKHSSRKSCMTLLGGENVVAWVVRRAEQWASHGSKNISVTSLAIAELPLFSDFTQSLLHVTSCWACEHIPTVPRCWFKKSLWAITLQLWTLTPCLQPTHSVRHTSKEEEVRMRTLAQTAVWLDESLFKRIM